MDNNISTSEKTRGKAGSSAIKCFGSVKHTWLFFMLLQQNKQRMGLVFVCRNQHKELLVFMPEMHCQKHLSRNIYNRATTMGKYCAFQN